MARNYKWLIICLFLAVFTAFIRYSHGIIQQDNYVGYAMLLPGSVNKVSFFDSRLLPGLPILIYLIEIFVKNYYLAGYIITMLSFIGSYFLLYKITGSRLSILPLVFPPILLNLATLIDTEFPFIFLILLAIYLLKKRRTALVFLVIGFSVWLRLAGFAVLFGVFLDFVLKKDFKRFMINLPYFSVPLVFFMLFNVHFFGSQNPLYQLITYEALHPGRIDIGIIQLGADLVRAARWGWFRILFSGVCYIVIFGFLWFKSLKFRKTNSLEFWIITGFFAFTLLVNLVPFLENLGRYLAPTIPLFWLVFSDRFKSEKWLYFLLPVSLVVVLM